MTRITRQKDPFAGKVEYCDLGRRISSYHSVQQNASLHSKWRPRYKPSKYVNQRRTTLVQNENLIVKPLKSESTSPSHSSSTAILKTSNKFWTVESSRQLVETAGRKQTRHRKKKLPLRLSGSNTPDCQSTASALRPENITNETRKIEPSHKELVQKSTTEWKRVEDGEEKTDNWQQVVVKAATAATATGDGPPCYHLLLEKLEFDLARGY